MINNHIYKISIQINLAQWIMTWKKNSFNNSHKFTSNSIHIKLNLHQINSHHSRIGFLFSKLTPTYIILTSTIHNTNLTIVKKFVVVMSKFSKIWKSQKFVDLFQQNWIRISLKANAKDNNIEKIKVYSLRIFDELHEEKTPWVNNSSHIMKLSMLHNLKKKRIKLKKIVS